jgi:hypothetical protein
MRHPAPLALPAALQATYEHQQPGVCWVSSCALKLTLASMMMCFLPGCASIKGPRVPAVFVIDKETDNRVLSEVQNYRDGKCIGDATKTCTPDRTERDTIVYDLKLIIDRNYENYAGSFERTEDSSIFLGEVSGASLTGVATLVGATATKDILTTASSLVQSTSVSAQKNYYQKQTSYAILNVMDSERAKKWAAIYDLLVKNNIDKYPLSQVLSDLVDYRKAGTALQALTSIQQTAGATKAAAATNIQETNKATGRTTTPAPQQNPPAPPQNP